jgi:uncharacterized protein
MKEGPKKIFNDPVYGFVEVPRGLILQLIDHPFFQRLRRIGQLGMTPFVYPGALHTRFHHALGALHLMTQAIEVLRSKGVKITDSEAEGAEIAILLHDIGHGPFSHALEHTLIDRHHEELSVLFMEKLNIEFDNKLRTAISIFKDEYPKKFLHQMVSGQLDMDRLDYLNRDSFFTGVSEGVIGSERIIKMLFVKNGQLVVEEKGIYSIEKFLIARRLMYWQVYLHKTVLSAEQMMIKALLRAKELAESGIELEASKPLRYFLYLKKKEATSDDLLEQFARLDDHDIWMALKNWSIECPDRVLNFLAKSLIDRKIFKLEFSTNLFEKARLEQLLEITAYKLGLSKKETEWLVFDGKESNLAYQTRREQILIYFKNESVLPISEIAEISIQSKTITKHYICFPKL